MHKDPLNSIKAVTEGRGVLFLFLEVIIVRIVKMSKRGNDVVNILVIKEFKIYAFETFDAILNPEVLYTPFLKVFLVNFHVVDKLLNERGLIRKPLPFRN